MTIGLAPRRRHVRRRVAILSSSPNGPELRARHAGGSDDLPAGQVRAPVTLAALATSPAGQGCALRRWRSLRHNGERREAGVVEGMHGMPSVKARAAAAVVGGVCCGV